MKKFLFVLTIIFCPFLCKGQNNTDLENNENSYVPLSEIERDGTNFFFTVIESYEGEFEENPIKFMENYFDVHGLLKTLEKEKIADLDVTFLSSKGSFNAQFSGKGDLKKNFHKCKNVLVPPSIMKELLKNHKGWTMVKNVHIAKGRKNGIDKQLYRVKLKKGNSTKRAKIFINNSNPSELSSLH